MAENTLSHTKSSTTPARSNLILRALRSFGGAASEKPLSRQDLDELRSARMRAEATRGEITARRIIR